MRFKKREHTESHDGGKFLKLKDGESVQLVFRGEIFERRVKWDGKTYVEDPSGNSRYKVNAVIFNLETKKFEAKIYEFPPTVYDTLSSINEEMPLEKTKIKITRQGTGTDTNYVIIPLGPVPANAIAAIEAVSLNILDGGSKPKPKLDEDGFPPDFGDPGPQASGYMPDDAHDYPGDVPF